MLRHVALMLLLFLPRLGLAQAGAASAPASAGCAAESLSTGRRLERSIDVDDVRRDYILDAPETLQPHQPVPLLLDFHGFGHSGAGVWRVSKFKDLAPAARFITVYPEGLPVRLLGHSAAGWEILQATNNRDLRFVTALLDHLERSYCIDRSRLYSTGFSNGAFLSNVLGCTMADRFAAIAPVAGGRFTLPCTPSRAMPVIIHHGRNDERVEVEQARQTRNAWVQLNGCRATTSEDGCEVHRECRDGVEVRFCEDDGAHSWPLKATKRISEFFARFSLPGKAAAVPAGHSEPRP